MKPETRKKYEITPERLAAIEASKVFVPMCIHCYEAKENCRCINCETVNIDEKIYPTIRILNKKGYLTEECCSGHINDVKFNPYIKFKENYKFNVMPRISILVSSFDDYTYEFKCNSRHYIMLGSEKHKIMIDTINENFFNWANELEENK